MNKTDLLILIMMGMVSLPCLGAAEGGAPDVEPSWQEQAVVELDMDEWDAARKLAKTNRREQRTQSKIILMAADLREWDRKREKSALVSGKTAYRELDDEVTMRDAQLLNDLLELGGQQLTEYTERLLEMAVNKVGSPEDAECALFALDTLPKERRPDSINALGAWLASEREKVNEGRALGEDVQAVFTNQMLLEILVNQIQVDKSMTQKAMDMLPDKIKHIVSSATDSYDAADCLILIEAPALPCVQENLARFGSLGTTLEQDIRIAVSTREIRYPGSTWYSARPPN